VDNSPTTLGGSESINVQPASALRDGGNLRVALQGFPANYNYLQVDGDEVDTFNIINGTLPSAWQSDAKGEVSVNHDYFTDAKVISTSPQVVQLDINPKAVWTDGTPITVADLQSYVQCQDGHDNRYQVAGTQGFDRVTSVTRGVDDRQAIITFREPYAEWLNLFSPLYPKSVTANPDAFNNSLKNGLPISAGPFKVVSIDRASQRIVLGRNPLWWGPKPKLDTITFNVLDTQDWVPGLQNNELDTIEIGEPIHLRSDVTMVRQSPDLELRHAPDPSNQTLTFNGAGGAILADPELRVAIAKGINRQAMVKALLFGITANPVTLDSHVYLVGQPGYQDNSAPLAYNADEANRELDTLGWTRHGAWREKNGHRLEVRYATNNSQSGIELAQIVQQNLSDIGVKVDIQPHPGTGYFSDVVIPGNFDIAAFGWMGNAFPLNGLGQIFAYDPNNPQGNYGHIGNKTINNLIQQAIGSLDKPTTYKLVNTVDQMLFAEGFSLPLYQDAGNYPVRTNVANYGAFGLATIDYPKIGFLK
jgi:peptide/nickel transport system substrate-binding protein